MSSIIDCVHTHQCHNFEVPVPKDLFDRMVADIAYRDIMQFNYPSRERFAKAGIGFLVQEIWQVFIVVACSFTGWNLLELEHLLTVCRAG